MDTENASRVTVFCSPFNNARTANCHLPYDQRGDVGSKAERELGRESVRNSMDFYLMSNLVMAAFTVTDKNTWATVFWIFVSALTMSRSQPIPWGKMIRKQILSRKFPETFE